MGRAAMFLLGIVLDVRGKKNNLPKVVMTFPCRVELLFTLFSSHSSPVQADVCTCQLRNGLKEIREI